MPRRAAVRGARRDGRAGDRRRRRRRQRGQRRQQPADARSLQRTSRCCARSSALRTIRARARRSPPCAKRWPRSTRSRCRGSATRPRRSVPWSSTGRRRSPTGLSRRRRSTRSAGSGETCTDTGRAIGDLESAFYAAQIAHHDEIAIQASACLNLLCLDRAHDLRMGQHWTRQAEALLATLPRSPEAGSVDGLREVAMLLVAEDRLEEWAQASCSGRSRCRRERIGRRRTSTWALRCSTSRLRLHELGRDGEAEPVIARAVALFTNLFGDDNGRVAIALLDEAEILTSLGRSRRRAPISIKALAIWQAQRREPGVRRLRPARRGAPRAGAGAPEARHATRSKPSCGCLDRPIRRPAPRRSSRSPRRCGHRRASARALAMLADKARATLARHPGQQAEGRPHRRVAAALIR